VTTEELRIVGDRLREQAARDRARIAEALERTIASLERASSLGMVSPAPTAARRPSPHFERTASSSEIADLVGERMADAQDAVMQIVGRQLLRGDHRELWRNIFHAVFDATEFEPGDEIAVLTDDSWAG
jgi:hypothetical protein